MPAPQGRAEASVTIEGGRLLRKSLKEVPGGLADLKAANRAAAEVAARASAALAPRGKTGKLARTIRAAGTTTAAVIRAGSKAVPYGPAVHWGRKWWPNRSAFKRVKSPTTPQPFLSDGATNSEGRWIPIYEKHIQEILDRVKGV
ncbi:hypothetical protein CVCC1112_2623 [Paenarthrobacter nicotinovorans]|uniref:hypothetical protein n=1 Tax=Paenarthrobacter nicotinovorans TaxID=29320 RepID=UPI0007CBF703|nr:hypothetical protein [Paenarthrobacter nicotinovorans]GAT87964.1 hypothetical protein CVCC1112_2623 [Paenarthrobacter nicotinovorans]